VGYARPPAARRGTGGARARERERRLLREPPWRSRLAAITSDQSAPLASRQLLLQRLRETAERLGAPDPFTTEEDDEEPGLRLPRPPNWGGYRLWAASVELWVEGEHRLHDRARWIREMTPAGAGRFHAESWRHQRLQP
jgi:pyridoxamine 5'-phosphate oxidase